MHWISIIFIGLASNIDNIGIGVYFGARSTRIPMLSNLFIAILGMAAAYSSITMGHLISGYMSQQHANLIGGIIIMALGAMSIRPKGVTIVKTSPLPASSDYNKDISWKESISLGIALSLNCLATGFGAGVSGVSPFMTAISVGMFSLITVAIGVRIGHQIAKTWLGKYSNVIGGLILIAIGLYEIFT
ncbi:MULTISPECIES: manganese efflux pump [Bacillales]|uniref:manganese efflux pump MntP n=1 Tax=Bacillales TaxID=1385 RepID=UPI0006A79DA3|nr:MULTISPECIES: manganese efflux pump [Bacillales]OBZ09185.1 sporulation membrane protein YtaF [Bacillus sp. FJAT-26390]